MGIFGRLKKKKEEIGVSSKSELKEEFASLKKEFEELSKEEVGRAERIVNLRAYVGCGCGGARTNIFAVVPDGVSFSYDNNEDFDVDYIGSYKGDGIKFFRGHVRNTENYNLDNYESI